MGNKKVKGYKILKINLENNSSLGNVPNYSSMHTKNSVLIEMLNSVTRFKDKEKFQWHLGLKVETCFSFSDHEKIKFELDLQEKIDEQVTCFLETQCNLVKVVGYFQRGYYHYHFYLCSSVINFDKIKTGFENQIINNQRKIEFEISKDSEWQNVMNELMTDSEAIYGIIKYLPSY